MPSLVIVDDSIFLTKKMKDWFEEKNFKILAIGKNGIEGEQLYFEYKPDILTLDITMPMKDGHACLKSIIKKDPKAKIIMISALDDKNTLLECINDGALGFIEKPLQLHDPIYCRDLLETIERVLNV